MDMQPVSSSMIAAIGYDADTQTLAVEFIKGGTYEYADVPPEEWEIFSTADSVGKYFLSQIKPNYTASKA